MTPLSMHLLHLPCESWHELGNSWVSTGDIRQRFQAERSEVVLLVHLEEMPRFCALFASVGIISLMQRERTRQIWSADTLSPPTWEGPEATGLAAPCPQLDGPWLPRQ